MLKIKLLACIDSYGGPGYNGASRLTPLRIDYIKHWMGKPVAHKYNKQVKLKSSSYIIWNDLVQKNRKTMTKLKKGTTYNAKYLYNHPNGSQYLSLYDSKNKWLGYINKNSLANIK